MLSPALSPASSSSSPRSWDSSSSPSRPAVATTAEPQDGGLAVLAPPTAESGSAPAEEEQAPGGASLESSENTEAGPDVNTHAFENNNNSETDTIIESIEDSTNSLTLENLVIADNSGIDNNNVENAENTDSDDSSVEIDLRALNIRDSISPSTSSYASSDDMAGSNPLEMQKYLREWRQDALKKAQYDSAIYIGDKLLAMTGVDDDAFWLAQVHFAKGSYLRALSFLTKHNLVNRNPLCRYLAGHCLVKEGRFDEALNVLGANTPANLRARTGGTSARGTTKRNRAHPAARAANGRAATSGLAAAMYVNDNRADDNTVGGGAVETPEAASVRKCEAAMCHLRGICYAKCNAFDRAKECYKDAVRIDVQCFEAFQMLMKNNLLAPDEEWQFLESLDFDSIRVDDNDSSGQVVAAGRSAASQEAAEFTRMLYTTRLSKYRNPGAFESAYDSLSTHYNLADNPDMLLARADLLYTQCRHREALAVTSGVLARDKHDFSIYPIHLACLHELRMKNELFLVSHELADHHPDQPCTWLAVGTYYFLIDKIAEARRYFSKASMMDAHFAPAWIGFAHTFAAEGEHDQAISAYSTAARLFMGTHLPQVFLAMQHNALGNLALAEEFLRTAYGLCRTDPLLLNEMGVVKYQQNHIRDAIQYFQAALRIAQDIDSEPYAWVALRTNLGHAYRRNGHLNRALAEFDDVLRLGSADAGVFTAKGLVLLEQGRASDAVSVLHEALALSPQDAIASDLLNKALEETLHDDPLGAILGWGDDGGVDPHVEAEMEALEAVLDHKKAEASAWMRAGGRTGAAVRAAAAKKKEDDEKRRIGGGSRGRVVVHEDEDADAEVDDEEVGDDMDVEM